MAKRSICSGHDRLPSLAISIRHGTEFAILPSLAVGSRPWTGAAMARETASLMTDATGATTGIDPFADPPRDPEIAT